MSDRPSTSSVLWAEWRRGLKDLQDVVLNPWHGMEATHEEPGTIANPTPQLVTEDITKDQGNSDREHNEMLDRYAEMARSREHEHEMEM